MAYLTVDLRALEDCRYAANGAGVPVDRVIAGFVRLSEDCARRKTRHIRLIEAFFGSVEFPLLRPFLLEFGLIQEAADKGYLMVSEPQIRSTSSGPEREPRIARVYFVRSGDAIKIGFTRRLKHRLATLQTAIPTPLELLVAVEGTEADERRIHQQFAHLRTSGEWFVRDQELLTFIARVIERQALP